ncbi:MAG: hypothetical protein LBP35_04605 [Candidatus Ancillula trichonymphae]|jgi:hypothetical protein|nr:hypothetical protein [Candidatus Ancillula trichonymphae]
MKTVKNMLISTLAVLLVVDVSTVDPRSAYASNTPSIHLEQIIESEGETNHFWTEEGNHGIKTKIHVTAKTLTRTLLGLRFLKM